MSTDYTAAITGLVAISAVLTTMVVFVLQRPSDLAQDPR